jgi:hypothetical protein
VDGPGYRHQPVGPALHLIDHPLLRAVQIHRRSVPPAV